MRPGIEMSIHDPKARSLVPAVPQREPLSAWEWFKSLITRWQGPPEVPEHLREDIGLPPQVTQTIFDYPLVDLRGVERKKGDWLN